MTSRTSTPSPSVVRPSRRLWLGVAVLLAAAGLGATRFVADPSKHPAVRPSTAQTADWSQPGIVADAAGRFALRDGRVTASLTREGVALAGRATQAESGWGLRWSLSGARSVEPRPQGELPGRVNRLQGEPSDWQTSLPHHAQLVYPEVYPGVALTIESRRHALAYRFDLRPGADRQHLRRR